MFISPDALDAALEHIIQNADKLYVCSQEPTTYTEAVDFALAEIDVSTSTFMGPLDYYGTGEEVLGRLAVVTVVNGTGSKGGSASCVALTGGDELLCVVTCNPVGVIIDVALAVRDWCLVVEYGEGDCVIPEGTLDQ